MNGLIPLFVMDDWIYKKIVNKAKASTQRNTGQAQSNVGAAKQGEGGP